MFPWWHGSDRDKTQVALIIVTHLARLHFKIKVIKQTHRIIPAEHYLRTHLHRYLQLPTNHRTSRLRQFFDEWSRVCWFDFCRASVKRLQSLLPSWRIQYDCRWGHLQSHCKRVNLHSHQQRRYLSISIVTATETRLFWVSLSDSSSSHNHSFNSRADPTQ